jgi:hypothetical protein
MNAKIPVRSGSFQYVLVRKDGSTHTLKVDDGDTRSGWLEVAVVDGDRLLEIALSSTSDPDLNPPRGQLWP